MKDLNIPSHNLSQLKPTVDKTKVNGNSCEIVAKIVRISYRHLLKYIANFRKTYHLQLLGLSQNGITRYQ